MGLKFVNITREEFLSKKLLHKFMPLEYALNTLEGKHLWFANPVTWKDPFEKRFIEATYKDSKGKISHFAWKDRVFCVCMTETSTSEAYWNTYSNQSIGIELKFNRERLLQALEILSANNKMNIFIGKVEYMKTSDIKKPLHSIPFAPPCNIKISTQECKARLLLLKRIAYKYEDEIRIMIVKKDKLKNNGIYLDFNCHHLDMIDSITLDPSIGPHVTTLLKNTFVHTYGFIPIKTNSLSKKFRYRVQKSSLYSEVNQAEIDI